MSSPPLRLPCRLCARIQLGIVFGQELPMLLCFGCAERMFAWVKAAADDELRRIWRFPIPDRAQWGPAPTTRMGPAEDVVRAFHRAVDSDNTARPSEELFDEAVEELRRGAEDHGPLDPAVDKVFKQFKKGLENVGKPDDSQTHHDLGIAYREMGLIKDALTEWMGIVRAKSQPRMKIAALEQMFHPAFMQEDGIERLRAMLFPG